MEKALLYGALAGALIAAASWCFVYKRQIVNGIKNFLRNF